MCDRASFNCKLLWFFTILDFYNSWYTTEGLRHQERTCIDIWTLLLCRRPYHTYLTDRLPGKPLFSTSVFALWRKSEEEGDCSDI